jgi:hypothetical protein
VVVVGTGGWSGSVRGGIRAAVAACLVASTVAAAAVPVGAVAGFGDVAVERFFAESVAWMVAEELTTGTGAGCFSPDEVTSRSQASTFIHRFAGTPPSAGGSELFRDVVEGSFYDAAVGWMVATGVTTGTSATTFHPDRAITRGEFAAFLWRYAGRPGATLGSASFGDVRVGGFYDRAVGWMVASGVTTGTSDATFHPDRPVSRGEIATFLWRHAGRPAASTASQGATCARTGEREPDAAATALDLLDDLVVAVEDRGGYDRDLFTHWSDLDRDGCDTRQEVLTIESAVAVVTSDGCRVISGEWLSLFDAVTVVDPSSLDIDHLIPLAEAWDSGASAWDPATRKAFANDQGDERSLIAVTASANRSKSDRDPAGWLPPAASYHCTYVTSWIAVKTRWSLSIDTAEKTALTAVLDVCPAAAVNVETVDIDQPTPTTPTTTTTAPGCHPAYSPCLPNLSGDALNCGDLSSAQRPVTVLVPGVDPYNLDGNNDGLGCT